MNPNAYPKVNPTVNNVCVKNATDPDNYLGVTPKMYLGMMPELSPIIIPTNILPKKRGKNDKSIHWTMMLMIAKTSNKTIRNLCLTFCSNFSMKNAPWINDKLPRMAPKGTAEVMIEM